MRPRCSLNCASFAFASGAAGSPTAAMLAAVPTLTKKPDAGPFQAHCPATHPPLGIGLGCTLSIAEDLRELGAR